MLAWETKRTKSGRPYYLATSGRCDGMVFHDQNGWQCSVSVDAVAYDWEIKPTKEDAMTWCEDTISQVVFIGTD